MRWLIYTITVLAGLIVLAIVGVFGIGALLPEEQTVTRSVVITKPPEVVWQTITDYAAAPTWRPQVRSVERLADQNGRAAWRVTDNNGDAVTMEVVDAVPPRRLVDHFTDSPDSNDVVWEFAIAPLASDTQVTITERARISKPYVRFLWRFVFGAKFPDDYLVALARKFGDPPVLQ